MAQAPEYSYYTDSYGGQAIEEPEWRGYAAKAAAYLTRLEALCKVTPYGDAEDALAMAVCALADTYRGFDAAEQRAAVASCSIGSVSTSYDATLGGSLDLSPAGRETALMQALSLYVHVFAGVR